MSFNQIAAQPMAAATHPTAAAAKQCYWISCSGDGFVSIDEDRLEVLLGMMPTLRFLFFGHPSMQQKELRALQDGTPILEIPPELRVSKKSFILLLHCAFEVEPLPPRGGKAGSRLNDLLETMATLGGCGVLEDRLRDHHENPPSPEDNPMTPEQDTRNQFLWQTIHVLHSHYIAGRDASDMMQKGYSYTTGHMEGCMRTHYYRAPKKNM